MNAIVELTEPIRRCLMNPTVGCQVRGAKVILDDTANDVMFAIFGKELYPFSMAGPEWDLNREITIIRGGLSDLSVTEVASGCFTGYGYCLLLRAEKTPELAECCAEGCWSPTARGTIQITKLLKALTDLAWQAWAEVQLPQLTKDVEEEEEREARWAAEDGDTEDGQDDPRDSDAVEEQRAPA